MLIYFSSLLHFAHQCCCTCVNNQAAWVTVVSYQVLELGNMTFFIKVCLGFRKDCVDFLAKIMKNHHFNEIVFQTINMEYLSIYIFFGFFLLVFYLFAYISCTCFVRFILKFYSMGIWIYIFNSFFLILFLNSRYSFLVHKKRNDFYILILYPKNLLHSFVTSRVCIIS